MGRVVNRAAERFAEGRTAANRRRAAHNLEASDRARGALRTLAIALGGWGARGTTSKIGHAFHRYASGHGGPSSAPAAKILIGRLRSGKSVRADYARLLERFADHLSALGAGDLADGFARYMDGDTSKGGERKMEETGAKEEERSSNGGPKGAIAIRAAVLLGARTTTPEQVEEAVALASQLLAEELKR